MKRQSEGGGVVLESKILVTALMHGNSGSGRKETTEQYKVSVVGEETERGSIKAGLIYVYTC